MRIARGIVCVRPVKFPANMIVAPNSETARAHARAAPPTSAGQDHGSGSRQNVPHGATPNVRGTSSITWEAPSNPS